MLNPHQRTCIAPLQRKSRTELAEGKSKKRPRAIGNIVRHHQGLDKLWPLLIGVPGRSHLLLRRWVATYLPPATGEFGAEGESAMKNCRVHFQSHPTRIETPWRRKIFQRRKKNQDRINYTFCTLILVTTNTDIGLVLSWSRWCKLSESTSLSEDTTVENLT